ncbi:putative vacuolar amino acid transporter YPQ3 [Colletotrichum sidae]|uniref:Putative vacuolar amino acid transporter YPQ3 n=1 Tax=Colletotrichum sidae TaxID=1347389 RepID=A0A4R8TQM1_9PEZI|nr:putative vacuolar amino acid transporter YPQ3 [Colletotrichum sidae]
MASLAVTTLAALSQSPKLEEALSGIFGSISVTAWICLLLPQLIANYKAQSADGLSMAFLVVWLIGDVTNLLGALFTHLAPTAVTIATYFCFADVVLIAQCVYYNTKNARRAAAVARRRSSAAVTTQTPSEREPLLSRNDRRRSSSAGLPGSHRRPAVHEESSLDPLRKMVTGEDETPDSNPWLHNTLSIAAVYIVGAAGWFVSYKVGAWDGPDADAGSPDGGAEANPLEQVGLVLGYFSAVCYLCARIPQIIKNYREKSCEGLALLFFLLSLTGNLTYGASLVAFKQDKAYLLNALPWLLGSLGTMAEDFIIFAQFHLYAPRRDAKRSDEV